MRTFIRLLLLLVIVLGAAWVALWWYAEGRMQAGIVNWANQTSATPNMKVSYDSIAHGTSPLAATVTLTNLRITVQTSADEQPVVVTLPSFAMEIDATNPLVVQEILPPQINFSGARGDGAITFGNVSISQHIDPQALFNPKIVPFRGADAAAGNINLLASGGSLMILHIDSYALHGVINRSAGAGQTAFSGNETFNGIALSPLLTKLGSVPFNGQIAQFGISMNIGGPVPAGWQNFFQQLNMLPVGDMADRRKITLTAMHDWAAQGGSASLGITLDVGPSALNADASVNFDANVQPSGTADVTADHLDAFSSTVTGAYPQLQGTVSQIEAELSPYLSTSDADGQVLTIHLTYGSGAVNINGQKVTDMPPVDWNTLENPPAPPAQAPGDGSGAQ
jgi:hypothetical protein